MTQSIIDVLQKSGLFSAGAKEDLISLGKKISLNSYKKGERIFQEGDKADKMYVIASGRVKVVKEFQSGKNAIMGIFGEGDTVAESAVIDKLPYPASAIALDDASVIAIPAALFIDFLKKNPDLLIRMIIGLGRRLREFVGNMGSLAVQSVEKRLARFLTKLSGEIGVEHEDGLELILPLTRQDLAEIIGTSFEVVERSLKKMREKGIIEAAGKRIVILKPKALEAIFTEEK
jgi:CRP/FNR family transcriptional regulator